MVFSKSILLVCCILVVSGLTTTQQFSSICLTEQKPMTQLDIFLSIVNNLIEAKETKWQNEKQDLPQNATMCKGLSKPDLTKEPQIWQDVSQRKLKVFSAYLERRLVVGGPAIRIIGTGFQEEFNEVGKLYCQLWYDDRKYPVVVGPAVYDRIYPSISHPDMWVSHFVLCKLPNGIRGTPFAVSVVPFVCDKAENQLLVLNRNNATKSNTHALCISPMYNNFKEWEMVIEWIEMHKLLGAKEITLYKFWITAQTKLMLESYLKESDIPINVINWPYPPLKSNVWCQRGALNDCLYRMGHKHKYVTITDMDEILMPRMEEKWAPLIKRLHMKDPQIGAFLFQHAYFRRNTSSEKPYLITQSSRWRTHEVVPAGKIRCKSMYDASKTVKIDLHFPYELVRGAKELIVDPLDGMLHHYRPYPMETFVKNPEKFTFIEDRFMEKYKHRLKDAVRKRHDMMIV